MYDLTLTTAAASEPVSLAQAKTQLRIDADGYDTDLTEFFIPSARMQVETFTDRQLITATYTMTFDAFRGRTINLPKGQLQSVTSVKYYDADDAQQTVSTDDYRVIPGDNGRIEFKNGSSIPSVEFRSDAVEVVYVCGYGLSATDVPDMLRTACLMQAAHLFEHRGDDVPTVATVTAQNFSVADWLKALVAPYRLADEFTTYGRM